MGCYTVRPDDVEFNCCSAITIIGILKAGGKAKTKGLAAENAKSPEEKQE